MTRSMIAVLVLSCGLIPCSLAGIPEPDAILYGTVWIDGNPVGEGDNVTVTARVDEASDAIATYHMGDNPAAGDSYVLRLRLESLADGSAQSDNAALIGQTARISVQQGTGPEALVALFTIGDRGQIMNRDLGAGDFGGDGDVDLDDFALFVRCLSGPGATTPPSECTPEQFSITDLDRDDDVDLDDFDILQAGFTG